MDHVLLIGPPGLGKTTLANFIAQEIKDEKLQPDAVIFAGPKVVLDEALPQRRAHAGIAQTVPRHTDDPVST